MKKVNFEIFKQALEQADQWKQNLVYSTTLYDYIQAELLRLNVQTNPTDTLLPIIYYFLGLLSPEEILDELSVLKIPDVHNFLNGVQRNINPTNQVVTVTNTEPASTLTAEISATERDMATLHNVRTMAHDMAAIKPGSDVVYQSSQADLFRPTAPTPAAPKAPSWDSAV